MNGVFLWATAHGDTAKNTGTARPFDLPPPWPAELRPLSPFRAVSLIAEGAKSRCRVSEKAGPRPVIFITGACGSAMTLAWYFLDLGCLPPWGSVLCASQWGGMGQFGRRWISPPGNLYGAFRLPDAAGDDSLPMSLIIGHMLVGLLRESEVAVQLKWPNDLLVGRKKVGGILIQERGRHRIAGVGLNLASAPRPGELRYDHAAEAVSLSEAGHPLSPLSLWQALMDLGPRHLHQALETDPRSAIDSITTHLAFLGEGILVTDTTGAPYPGTLLGLSADGGLEVRTGETVKIIRSGSIFPLERTRKEP